MREAVQQMHGRASDADAAIGMYYDLDAALCNWFEGHDEPFQIECSADGALVVDIRFFARDEQQTIAACFQTIVGATAFHYVMFQRSDTPAGVTYHYYTGTPELGYLCILRFHYVA